MKRTHSLVALVALWLWFLAAPHAVDVTADVKVIANPSVSASEISLEDLAKAGRAHDVVLKPSRG